MAPKRATPRKPPATPRKRSATADPASSSEEDSSGSSTSHDQEAADEEMGESESEEVEDAAAAAAAAAADEKEESESAEDGGEGEGEEESTEDGDEWEAEADLQLATKNPPQSSKLPTRKRGKTPAPAPAHQNGEKKGRHIESAERKPKKSRRMWSPCDEVLILEELAKHRRQHGKVPAWGDYAFFESVAKRLEDSSCHYFVVKEKVRSLLRRYKSHILSVTDHDKLLDNLSEDVWGDLPATDDPINGGKQAKGAMVRVENGGNQTQIRSFEEMCEVYPLLAQEVKMLAEVQPVVKSLFTRLDAKRALYMEKKMERIRSTEVKIQARMAAKVHAPKAKISEKLVRLLT